MPSIEVLQSTIRPEALPILSLELGCTQIIGYNFLILGVQLWNFVQEVIVH